ncbi:DUF4132 domain-containing protein [Streptomyces xiangluensis]|uniref:DUF4132 domain-containing protein n=1 Tax=Streptomyces xiangluensis TaxID=2665720 RepID=A0ABV8YXG1_9ACTN
MLRHSAGMYLQPLPYAYHLPARGALAALLATAGEPGVGAQRRALPGLPPQAARVANEVLDKITAAELPPHISLETLLIGRGEYTVSMKVRPDGGVVLEFRDAKGRVLVGVPRELSEERPATLAALRRRLLTVRARADRERGELAEMFATGTELTGRQWYGRWLYSPTAAPMNEALIWERRSPSGTATGLPVRTPAGAWLLCGVGGAAHEVGPEDTVRLWQPSLADRAEVSAWRARLRRHKVRQPTPQLPPGFASVVRNRPRRMTSRPAIHHTRGRDPAQNAPTVRDHHRSDLASGEAGNSVTASESPEPRRIRRDATPSHRGTTSPETRSEADQIT